MNWVVALGGVVWLVSGWAQLGEDLPVLLVIGVRLSMCPNEFVGGIDGGIECTVLVTT